MIDPRVRPMPYPYKAGLAFSNDTDFLRLDSMLALHRYLATPVADGGAGVECSDSFFFYEQASPWPNFSYFQGATFTEQPHAPLLRELIRTGYLDTTHALGYFDAGSFSRRHAETALETLQRHGLELKAWTNHGGHGNIQNIGGAEYAYHHKGDLPESGYYHMDLVAAMGIHYFALCSSYTSRFCLSPRARPTTRAQRAPGTFRWAWPWRRVRHGYQQKNPSWNDREEILYSLRAQDGAALQCFLRYSSHLPGGDFPEEEEIGWTPDRRRPGPNLGRLALQVNEEKLDALAACGGAAILYQHFSTNKHVPRRTHITPELAFQPENDAVFHLLAKRMEKGELWVAALGILLDYLYMVNTIAVHVRVMGQRAVIEARPRPGYEYRGIDGLTVAVPEAIKEAVFLDPSGKERRGEVHERDGRGTEDEQTRSWAGVPVRRLPAMDWNALAKEAKIDLPERIAPRLTEAGLPVGL